MYKNQDIAWSRSNDSSIDDMLILPIMWRHHNTGKPKYYNLGTKNLVEQHNFPSRAFFQRRPGDRELWFGGEEVNEGFIIYSPSSWWGEEATSEMDNYRLPEGFQIYPLFYKNIFTSHMILCWKRAWPFWEIIKEKNSVLQLNSTGLIIRY